MNNIQAKLKGTPTTFDQGAETVKHLCKFAAKTMETIPGSSATPLALFWRNGRFLAAAAAPDADKAHGFSALTLGVFGQ